MLENETDYFELLRFALDNGEYASRGTGRTTRLIKSMDYYTHLIVHKQDFKEYLVRLFTGSMVDGVRKTGLNRHGIDLNKNIHVIDLTHGDLPKIKDGVFNIKLRAVAEQKVLKKDIKIVFDHHWLYQYYQISLERSKDVIQFWKGDT